MNNCPFDNDLLQRREISSPLASPHTQGGGLSAGCWSRLSPPNVTCPAWCAQRGAVPFCPVSAGCSWLGCLIKMFWGGRIKEELSAFPTLDLKSRLRERTWMNKGRGELQAALSALIWGFQPCSLWRESCAFLEETAIKADKPKDPD